VEALEPQLTRDEAGALMTRLGEDAAMLELKTAEYHLKRYGACLDTNDIEGARRYAESFNACTRRQRAQLKMGAAAPAAAPEGEVDHAQL